VGVRDALATAKVRTRASRRVARRLVIGTRGLGPAATLSWAIERARRTTAAHENSSLTWVEASTTRTTRVWVANYWGDTYHVDRPSFEASLIARDGTTAVTWTFVLEPDQTVVIDARERCADAGIALPFSGLLLLRVADEALVAGRPVQVFAEYVADSGEASGVHGQYGLVRVPAAQILCAMRAEVTTGTDATRTAIVVTNGYDGAGGPRPIRTGVTLHRADGASERARVPALAPLASSVVYLDELFPDAASFLGDAPGHVRVTVPCPSSRIATFVDYPDGRRIVNHGTIDRVFDQLHALPIGWHDSKPVASCPVLLDGARRTVLTFPNVWGPDRADHHVVIRVHRPDGSLVLRTATWIPADGLTSIDVGALVDTAGEPQPFVGHAEVEVDATASSKELPSTFDLLVGIYEGADLLGEVQVGSDYFNAPVPPGLTWPGGRSTRTFSRVRLADGVTTRIFIGYPASASDDLEPARPRLTLINAAGTDRLTTELELPVHGCVSATIDELFPDAAALLSPEGHGLLRVRDTGARLYGYHAVETEGARSFPIDHLVGG
jgi:hypothetical protein